jgi:serine/threonine-protein kinase
MQFNLIVLEGSETGKIHSYSGNEADNILVGREDLESQAKIRLSSQDPYVSRSQFMLEFRPPNILLRDPLSANGTRISRQESEWELVEETLLADGDLIKVGNTILRFELVVEKPPLRIADQPEAQPEAYLGESLSGPIVLDLGSMELLPVAEQPEALASAGLEIVQPPEQVSEPVEPAAEPQQPFSPPKLLDDERYCIRCNRKLEQAPAPDQQDIRDLDFMCMQCRLEVSAERREIEQARLKQPAPAARLRILCEKCGKDITRLANQDGRAEDLAGVVSYLCEACADQQVRGTRQVIGDYLVLKELGRGGMGVVYRAWHQKSGRVVALKKILPAAQMEDNALQRFQREMSIMQDLKHTNLVRLIASGSEANTPYFVSELVSGGNLDQFISPQGQPLLPPAEICQVIVEALVGLEYLHQRGYVHRDIKPENILFERSDHQVLPKLVDFGLAKSYEKYGGTITRTGECAGTLMYMPPEQITQFKYCKPPVDIYAMGVTLYYLLTGYYSLEFPSPREIQRRGGPIGLRKDPVRMILDDAPIPVSKRRSDLPPAVCAVVDQATRKKAADRFPTAASFRQALLDALSA